MHLLRTYIIRGWKLRSETWPPDQWQYWYQVLWCRVLPWCDDLRRVSNTFKNTVNLNNIQVEWVNISELKYKFFAFLYCISWFTASGLEMWMTSFSNYCMGICPAIKAADVNGRQRRTFKDWVDIPHSSLLLLLNLKTEMMNHMMWSILLIVMIVHKK